VKTTIEIFSENVKALIKSSCKNYDDAAARLKIGRSTVDQLVSGKFNPSMEMIDKICKGLELIFTIVKLMFKKKARYLSAMKLKRCN